MHRQHTKTVAVYDEQCHVLIQRQKQEGLRCVFATCIETWIFVVVLAVMVMVMAMVTVTVMVMVIGQVMDLSLIQAG
jgi:ABC-type multidrug transport system permease subunit